jgi:hypothetical protein
MNNKFSIGVVVAIVLQVSAFVWWTAQQAQTIEQLNTQVSELTSRMAIEDSINLRNSIERIDELVLDHDAYLDEIYYVINDLVEFARFTENRWADVYGTNDTYERKFGTK